MCGRFLLSLDPADLQKEFPQFTIPDKVEPKFNISPTQPVMAVPNDSSFQAQFFLWGLIPSWSKEPAIATRLINARSETLAEKPTFRNLFKYHRCLILANGFYEWKQESGVKTKTPYLIQLKNNKPFAFAGLWDEWHASDGSSVRTCTIITTIPNDLVRSVHDRMPVILPTSAYSAWLDPAPQSPGNLQGLLRPFPPEEMIIQKVSQYVNNPANQGPETIVGVVD